MINHSNKGISEIPIISGAMCFVASIVGLYVAFRASDFNSIVGNLSLYFIHFIFFFFAFESGRVFGQIYHAWWANYICAFISIAVVTCVYWAIVGSEAVPSPSASDKSNWSASIFIGWLVPAWYGIYSHQRRD